MNCTQYYVNAKSYAVAMVIIRKEWRCKPVLKSSSGTWSARIKRRRWWSGRVSVRRNWLEKSKWFRGGGKWWGVHNPHRYIFEWHGVTSHIIMFEYYVIALLRKNMLRGCADKSVGKTRTCCGAIFVSIYVFKPMEEIVYCWNCREESVCFDKLLFCIRKLSLFLHRFVPASRIQSRPKEEKIVDIKITLVCAKYALLWTLALCSLSSESLFYYIF